MKLKLTLFSLYLLFSSPAWGADAGLSLEKVLEQTLNHHPDIDLSRIEQRSLHIQQQNILGQLDPTVAMSGSLSDETTPTTNPFAASGTKIRLLTGSIKQPFENGSSLTASLQYSRSHLQYPASVPLKFQSSINPTYQHQIDLIYRYPLLRGFNNTNYHEQLTANDHQQAAASWQVAITQEQLAAQAITLYYQIAANQIAQTLALDAVKRAKKLLTYQKKREHFGLIEKADRLQAEALLASRDMEYRNAQAILSNSITSLNRLMLRHGNSPLHIHLEAIQTHIADQSMHDLLQQSTQQRPIFHMLDAKLAANAAAIAISHDASDIQLDMIGQVGSRALSGSASSALQQGFTLNDRYISIGFELSDTLIGKSKQAAILKAELESERIALQRKQALEAIETSLSSALNDYQNAKILIKSSKAREKAEKLKFSAEMKRYQEGRSDTASIVQFEGELRNAELQAALQEIQKQLAIRKLQLASGTLLQHWIEALD